jgi:1-acyl-sn-glycerol-3-phosphate acyltransferase
MYSLIFLIVRLWQGKRQRVVIDDAPLRSLTGPYILLANHESFFDFYYISQIAHPRRPSYLVNEYYCTRPILKTMARKGGILAKKLFTRDIAAPVGILRTIRAGWPVVIFPEGRLSPDGRSNPIVEKGAAFYKKLGCDLVLVKIDGAYFASPKWRRRSYRSEISVRVLRVVGKDELRSIPDAELDKLIADTLYNDASVSCRNRYPQRDKAVGLEGVLYRCADCGALYTTVGEGSTLRCTACGRVHTLDRHYRFADAPDTIPGWYDRIKELERAELDRLDLRAAVRTRIFGKGGGPVRKETGECRLTPAGFSYQSASVSFEIPIDRLPALAFSCGLEFELYHHGELYYFYPREHPQQAARWALAVDLLAEKRRQT